MKQLIPPKQRMSSIAVALALAGMAAVPMAGWAQTKSNPNCPAETVFYNPGHGEDIVVPKGFKVEVFARDLNFPTDVAFVGNKDRFQVVVLESGTGLPSRCNDNRTPQTGGPFAPDNPFTPDVIVFDQSGRQISGRLGKPTPAGLLGFRAMSGGFVVWWRLKQPPDDPDSGAWGTGWYSCGNGCRATPEHRLRRSEPRDLPCGRRGLCLGCARFRACSV